MNSKRARLLALASLIAVAVAAAVLVGSGGTAQASKPPKDCTRTSIGQTPLIDMGTTKTYMGAEGGLYPGGQNTPPADYLQKGITAANAVVPRDLAGNPSATGVKLFISIGFSVTRQEFLALTKASKTDTLRSKQTKLLNAASSMVTGDKIANPNDPYWTQTDQHIQAAGNSNAQVQVVWLKTLSDANLGFPGDPQLMQMHLEQSIANIYAHFPNVKIIYISSRSYGGYITNPNQGPEPTPYETGFAVKWTIQDAINGQIPGNAWIGWGPYFWTDGMTPRSDGLIWRCEDTKTDGMHPSDLGTQKTNSIWLNQLHTDPTATPWYVAH